MKRAQPGFTLLELMVVLAIAGILMAVAIPAMGNFMRNARITGVANEVMTSLHFTRSEAIKRRDPVTFCTSQNAVLADNTANLLNATCAASPLLTGWIVFVDLNQSGQRDAGEAILVNHGPIDDRITARASANPFRVTYLLTGLTLNTPTDSQLVLCDARGNVATDGVLSSARGILISVIGRAGVTRDPAEIQELVDAIGVDVSGCEA